METNKTILMVEDNPDHVALALRALKKADVNTGGVTVANNGNEALAYLAGLEDAKLPRLILLDLGLPGMSGLDVLKQIRGTARTACLPVVVLTTSDEYQDKRRGYLLGANSYVCKPVEFPAFIDAMRQLGQYWLDLNEALTQC